MMIPHDNIFGMGWNQQPDAVTAQQTVLGDVSQQIGAFSLQP